MTTAEIGSTEIIPESVPVSRAGWKHFLKLLNMSKPPVWVFVLAVGLSLVDAVAGLVVPLFTRDLIDQFTKNGLAVESVVWLAGAFILQTAAGGFSYYLMAYIGESVVSGIRTRLWSHVLKLRIPYFDQHQSGELMSRVIQDSNTVKALVSNHLVTLVSGLVSIIGGIAILFVIDWRMTLIMLIAVPLAMLVLNPLGRFMYKVSLQTQDEMAELNANLGRVLSEIRLVKSSNSQKLENARGQDSIRRLYRFGLREAKIMAVVSPLMTTVMMAVLVILIGYGGARVASGDLSAGSLVAVILYVFQIVMPFSQLAAFFTSFQKAMGATERIRELLQNETEDEQTAENSAAAGKPLTAGDHPVVDWDQPLVFDHVSFGYKPGETVLSDVSFTVRPGQTVAFVGPSGGGKTTIFSLIERFYQPDAGEIRLGSANIQDLPLMAWRESIGYVPQDSAVMAGTIRENIIYGLEREVSEAELEQAARLANAHEFIDRLPQGYDTEVGERGIRLSGGQRQRLAIARALLRNPKLLLLDEATSNLDSESEALVQHALSNLMEGRTTLIIAHRLSTVVGADHIIFLDNGVITGQGTHRELMETHDRYRKFVDQQLKKQPSGQL